MDLYEFTLNFFGCVVLYLVCFSKNLVSRKARRDAAASSFVCSFAGLFTSLSFVYIYAFSFIF